MSDTTATVPTAGDEPMISAAGVRRYFDGGAVKALDGIDLIGEGAASDHGGRGVRLRGPASRQ